MKHLWEHLWKGLIVLGSTCFVYALLQFSWSSKTVYDGMYDEVLGSLFRVIDEPYDLVGAVSFGIIVLGLLIRKKE